MAFILDIRSKIGPKQSLKDIQKKQKQPSKKPLKHFVNSRKTRDENMAQAYLSWHYTLAQVGEHFGVSYVTVSWPVKHVKGRD